MKAVSARAVPTGDAWSYEPKWDGHRVLVRRVGDDFDAVSSTGKPKLPQWPWLRRAVAAATDHDVVLDGEVVAYDDEGRHTFQSVGRADRDHCLRRLRSARPRRRRTCATGHGVNAGNCWSRWSTRRHRSRSRR